MTGMCRGKTRVLLPGEDKGQQTMEHCSPLSTPRLDRQDSLSLGNTRIMQARTGGERNKNRPTSFIQRWARSPAMRVMCALSMSVMQQESR